MMIISNDILIRTETGHCTTTHTLMALPYDLQNTTATSPQSENGTTTSVVLTISPTPIAAAVEVRADIVEIKTTDKANGIQHETPWTNSESVPSPADHKTLSQDDMAPSAVQNLAVDADSVVHKKSHTFIYRWLHHTMNSAASAGSEDSHVSFPHGAKSASEDSLHSLGHGIGDGTLSRKPPLIYRLFHYQHHHHQHQHDVTYHQHHPTSSEEDPDEREEGKNRSSRSLRHSKSNLSQTANQEQAEGGDSTQQPCNHPDHAGMSPQGTRRTALMTKLFHHLHSDATEHHQHSTSSLHGAAAFFSLPRRKGTDSPLTGSSPHSSTDFVDHQPSQQQGEEHKDKKRGRFSRKSVDGAVEAMSNSRPSTSRASVDSGRDAGSETGGTSHQSTSARALKHTDSGDFTSSRKGFHMFKSLLMPPKQRAALAMSSSQELVMTPPSSTSEHSIDKYGQPEKVIGKGAGGTVKLFHKCTNSGPRDDKLYAVKVGLKLRFISF